MTNQEKEEILGVFSLEVESGRGIMARLDPCVLCFTTKRLIVDKRKGVSDRLQFATQRLLGGGRGGTIYIRFKAGARDRLKWEQMSPDSYLEGNPDALEIPYHGIKAIEIKGTFTGSRKLLVFGEDLDTPNYQFVIASKSLLTDLEQFLKTEPVLADKV